MTTVIQLSDKGYLHVKEGVNAPLTFAIAEIQDISKRKGSSSKTILLPGNQNNNLLLGHLFNINVDFSVFDINIKQDCSIIQDGVTVLEGYLQLNNIRKISPSSPQEDEYVEYEVIVRDTSADFFSSMQEKLLEDLSGFQQYNHIYTLTGITSTSGHTSDDAYTYFLPWKANEAYRITDFAPAIYAKKYWDRIFSEAEYTYTWDSLEECDFHNLIVPYNGDTPISNGSLFNFKAGFDTGSTVSFIASASTLGTSFGVGSVLEPLNFDTEIIPNVNYNPLTGTYTSPIINNTEFRIKYTYRIEVVVPVDCYLTSVGSSAGVVPQQPQFGVQLFNQLDINDITQVNLPYIGPALYQTNIGGNIDFTAGTTLVLETQADTSTILDLVVGDAVTPNILCQYLYIGRWLLSGTTSPLTQSEIPYFIITRRINVTDVDNNYFTNNINGSLNEGQEVDVKSFIPRQVKQRDFIQGIVRMFNLYIYPEKYNPTNLIIKTRNDYYDQGPVVDWSQKIDIGNDTKLEFLPDLQDKRLILSYKPDTDEWNKQYQLGTGEVYGQVQYSFINEFVQSTKKIETIFSPTLIVYNGNGLLVPSIVAQAPKTNIRILRYNGWVDGGFNYRGRVSPLFVAFNQYPQALHLDNPINPTIDINYAEPDYYGYSSYETVTNNNLYNRFWGRFINQIETGKLLTASFYLTPKDIQELDLSQRVWVNNAYWNINKITDYNANLDRLTRVELISVDEGLKSPIVILDKNSVLNPIVDVGPKNNWITNFVSIQAGLANNTFGTSVFNTQILGNNNIIQGGSDSVLILGDGNNYAGKFGFVSGQDNVVEGNEMYIFGGSGQTYSGDSIAVFNVPLVATSISATTLIVDGEPFSLVEVWEEGTGGVAGFAIRAKNDSGTDAFGDYAVAEGGATLANGNYSHAEGLLTVADNESSHSEGSFTTASGIASHAEGNSTTASGNQSHAEGQSTQALGDFGSHAEGNAARAIGESSHAEGISTRAIGIASHAEGAQTTAQGNQSHAEGVSSYALGLASHAGGVYSTARHDGEISSNGIASTVLGDRQFGIVNGTRTTTNATPATINFTIDSVVQNGWQPPLAVQTTGVACGIRYTVTVRNTTTAAAALLTGECLVKYVASTPSIVGTNPISAIGDPALAAISATPSIVAGSGISINCTGIAATTLEWGARFDYSY